MPDSPKNDVSEAELQTRIKTTAGAIERFERVREVVARLPDTWIKKLQLENMDELLGELRTELAELKQGVVTHA